LLLLYRYFIEISEAYMKQNFYFFKALIVLLFLTVPVISNAQVTVTSSDLLSCTVTSTTLTANLEGDTPTNVGITSDDIYSAAIPIGFPFNYYGVSYTQCVVGANGTINFNISAAGGGDPWPISAPLLGNSSKFNNICGPWCDIDIFYGTPTGTETYSVDGVTPNRKFVVTWCGCSMFSCSSQLTTSQIILYESTNVIEVHIAQKLVCAGWNGGLAIIGVQNATGTAATTAPGRDYPAVWTVPPTEAWRFTPDAAGASYTCTSISYAPVPYASSSIYWYNVTAGTYLGTGPTQYVSPLVPTLYRACALGCSDTSSGYYLVTPAPFFTISLTKTDPTRCGLCDGTITIDGFTPGTADTLTYTLGGVAQPPLNGIASTAGTLTLTGLCQGTYDNFIGRQGGLCISNTAGPITLTDPGISMTVVPTNPSVCGACDGSLTLTGLYPGHVYVINFTKNGVAQPPVSAVSDASGNITISGLCDADTFDGIIASFGACATPAAGPFTLLGPPPPGVNIASYSSPTECGKCNGVIRIRPVIPFSSDTIFYTYGTTVMPQFPTVADGDSTITLPGLCAGSYYNMSVKIGRCTIPVSGTAILVDPLLEAHFGETTHLGCHGDSVFFANASTSTGALYYLWSFGDGSSDSSVNPVHVYPEGTYTVHLTATNHYCNSQDSTTFTLGHPLHSVFTQSPTIMCQGTTDTVINSSIGATGYVWHLGNGLTDTNTNATYQYRATGTYDLFLVAQNDIPCYDTLHKTIFVDTISGIKITLTDSVACAGTYTTMTGSYAGLGNTGITWVLGDNMTIEDKNPLSHAYAVQGVYTITATAHYRACQDTSASRTMTIFQQPNINIGSDTSICKGSTPITIGDNLNAANSGATWLWNTGERTRKITITAPGKYYATENINTCYTSDSIEVSNDCYVSIPNAFTPNGDGVNDYFFPRQLLTKGLVAFKMNIYNRWGQLIFETSSTEGAGWDGRLNGVDQQSGVYVYIIDAAFKDGQNEHHQGNITLLR
jgi:gliding motility-associated-like protein